MTLTKPSSAPRVFTKIQEAINEAATGSTITVEGRCAGPATVSGKSNLTIQGVPNQGCPRGGLAPGDLTSTVTSASAFAIRVIGGSGIKIQYLNIVDAPTEGVELKDTASRVFCNCIARNEEGVELDGARASIVEQNLIEHNEVNGIRVTESSRTAKTNHVIENLVRENGAHGIVLEDHSHENIVEGNTVERNLGDGVRFEKSDENGVTDNTVTGNTGSGIPLEDADDNFVDQNVIGGNGDGQVNRIDCASGNGNAGSNVTSACQ